MLIKLIFMKKTALKVFDSLHKYKVRITSEKKTKQILNNCESSNIPDSLINDYIKNWSYFEKPSINFLKAVTAVSGIFSSKYVPESLHYSYIEPVLNNRGFALTYNDKNFYDRYFSTFKDLFPIVVLRRIDGVFFDKDYNSLHNEDEIGEKFFKNREYIMKPSVETGGGDNVKKIILNDNTFQIDDKKLTLKELVGLFKSMRDFIIQERIIQNKYLSSLNESSLNTLRLYTYRSVKDEKISPLSAYIRFGNPGSIVDSSSQNGKTLGVKLNGFTNDFAITKFGIRIKDENIISAFNLKFPKFNEIISLSREIGKLFPYHRFLGFDFTLDENDNIKLLEVNNLYIGIINQQMNTGPLYGDFFNEIIDYAKNPQNEKTISFNYKI
jgi:hypothetical protein